MGDELENNHQSRKFQVFISSTFQDLQHERNKVLEVVVDRGHIPIALERFSASDESVRRVIDKTIQQCQIYVVLLGHRYGAREKRGGRSFTHIEFEYAKQSGLTILPFVLDEKEITGRRNELAQDVSRRQAIKASLSKEEERHLNRDVEELQSDADLARFHDDVKKARFWKPFASKDERFHYLVSKALEFAEGHTDRPAWVLEPSEPTLRNVFRSVSRNPFIVEIVDELTSLDALDERCLDQPDKKEALAETFVDLYQDAIFQHDVNVFLESGSTVAYVGKKLGPYLEKAAKRRGGSRHAYYSTNNVLSFLQLWLIQRTSCSLFPWGPPEGTYGAVFGDLDEEFLKEPEPRYPPVPLSRRAKDAIRRLTDHAFSISKWKGLTLFLGAVSGLQLSDNVNLTGRSLEIPFPSSCRGPHVGSWTNKLFKRFMYDTKQPIVVFLTDDKIDSPIDIGKCHFILDHELPWETFCKEYPLAFCVGCQTADVARAQSPFVAAGFGVVNGRNYGECSAFIARNAAFIEQFEKPAGVELES